VGMAAAIDFPRRVALDLLHLAADRLRGKDHLTAATRDPDPGAAKKVSIIFFDEAHSERSGRRYYLLSR